MGLAASQVRLLGLTARKSDIELQQSINAMHKLDLARESSEITRTYNAKLQAKQLAYYANGKYNKLTYKYLMGYNENFYPITNDDKALKNNPNMILSDYKGRVVLSSSYADAIRKVVGSDGGTFDRNKIADIISELLPDVDIFSPEVIKGVMNGGVLKVSDTMLADVYNALTGKHVGQTDVQLSAEGLTSLLKSIIDFYSPIFLAAATNGWTTEYNSEISNNEDYVSDALISGTLQLQLVDEVGNYRPGGSLTYFITAGEVERNSSVESREELTAWYNAEKERIEIKESALDLELTELSTELEAVKTEITSIQSFIDDAIQSVFNWANG